jgi:hypothetical protein
MKMCEQLQAETSENRRGLISRRKDSLTLTRIEPRFLGYLASSLVTITTALFLLQFGETTEHQISHISAYIINSLSRSNRPLIYQFAD